MELPDDLTTNKTAESSNGDLTGFSPVREFDIQAFSETEAEEKAGKHLKARERIIDLELMEKGRNGFFTVAKKAAVFRVTVVSGGFPAPFTAEFETSLEKSISFTEDGAFLQCPLKKTFTSGPSRREALVVARSFLLNKGVTQIDEKQLSRALSEQQEEQVLVASCNGMVTAKKTANCTLLRISPPGPCGEPVSQERVCKTASEIPESLLQAVFDPSLNKFKTTLVFSKDIPPLLIIWGANGVEVRKLGDSPESESPPEKEGERLHDFVMQILDECGVTGLDRHAVKRLMGVPDSTRVVVAPCDGSAEVEIPHGAMKAFITVHPPNHGKSLTLKRALKALKDKGVTAGVDENEVARAVLAGDKNKKWRVAAGKPAQKGEPARWELMFSQGTEFSEDEKVDHYAFFSSPSVDPGTLLAEKVPAEPGIDGFTVTGDVLFAGHGEDVVMIAGENARMDGKERIIAVSHGRPSVSKGRIRIQETMKVDGDVDFSTGNIDFHGDVIVTGNVLDGFSVCSKNDIIIKGTVGNAYLKAGGNIVIGSGLVGHPGAYAEAGGDLKAKFIENACVVVEGTVKVRNSIFNSQIFARQVEVASRRGCLIGGNIAAAESIRARELGSPSCTKTLIQVGGDPFLIHQLQKLEDEMKNQRKDNSGEDDDDLQEKIEHLEKSIEESFQKPSGKLEIVRAIFPNVSIRIGPDIALIRHTMVGCTIKDIEDINIRSY